MMAIARAGNLERRLFWLTLGLTVLARDDDETFEVSPEQESALLLAIGEAERGETISGEQLLESLRRRV